MTPSVEAVLRNLAAEMAEMAPQVQPAYCGAQLVFASQLLTAASESWENAAHDLVEENQALRQLFRKVMPLVANSDLVPRLQAGIDSLDSNLRISALTATNEELRQLLTDLHAIAELIDSDAGREADDAIWSEISASVRRRQRSSDMYS